MRITLLRVEERTPGLKGQPLPDIDTLKDVDVNETVTLYADRSIYDEQALKVYQKCRLLNIPSFSAVYTQELKPVKSEKQAKEKTNVKKKKG